LRQTSGAQAADVLVGKIGARALVERDRDAPARLRIGGAAVERRAAAGAAVGVHSLPANSPR
jgi:hypothetical protein